MDDGSEDARDRGFPDAGLGDWAGGGAAEWVTSSPCAARGLAPALQAGGRARARARVGSIVGGGCGDCKRAGIVPGVTRARMGRDARTQSGRWRARAGGPPVPGAWIDGRASASAFLLLGVSPARRRRTP